jgi:hypothetical protein
MRDYQVMKPPKGCSFKPGAGWQHISGPVWEHASGARIHTNGTIRMPDKKTFLSYHDLANYFSMNFFIRVNGGNRKRGLMAMTVNLVKA